MRALPPPVGAKRSTNCFGSENLEARKFHRMGFKPIKRGSPPPEAWPPEAAMARRVTYRMLEDAGRHRLRFWDAGPQGQKLTGPRLNNAAWGYGHSAGEAM